MFLNSTKVLMFKQGREYIRTYSTPASMPRPRSSAIHYEDRQQPSPPSSATYNRGHRSMLPGALRSPNGRGTAPYQKHPRGPDSPVGTIRMFLQSTESLPHCTDDSDCRQRGNAARANLHLLRLSLHIARPSPATTRSHPLQSQGRRRTNSAAHGA